MTEAEAMELVAAHMNNLVVSISVYLVDVHDEYGFLDKYPGDFGICWCAYKPLLPLQRSASALIHAPKNSMAFA